MPFFHQRHAAHRPARRQARSVERQAAATILVFEQGEMSSDLAIEL